MVGLEHCVGTHATGVSGVEEVESPGPKFEHDRIPAAMRQGSSVPFAGESTIALPSATAAAAAAVHRLRRGGWFQKQGTDNNTTSANGLAG
jgi:hypothetical protein